MTMQSRYDTPQPRHSAARVRFGEFEVDLRSRELLRGGRRVPLQDRPFEVLAALLERPGEVILRQELQDRLWPGQIVEFDNNLNTALTKLRRALDDTADAPKLIETLPKRGYRLLMPVETIEEAQPSAEMARSVERRPAGGVPRWGWLLVLAAVVALSSAGVWQVLQGALPRQNAAEAGAPVVPDRTALLVVLPLSSLDEDERLADVVTEELINRLAELLPPELGVIARTSAMRFKGAAADLATVREALNVDYVLEGSVSRGETGLLIHARFIHAIDQAHLWADSYEAPLEELPRVQRAVAERVATAVAAQLRARGSLTVEQPVPPEAWDAYLQARFLLSASPAPSRDTAAQAAVHLERAVERAPGFALAWAALADAIYQQPGPARERHARSRVAAERALEIDPTLSRARHRLANLALYQRWDWNAAAREYERAISLAPYLALHHHSQAAWHSTQGRHDEALAAIERALRLDPLSVVLHADAGWYLYVARRYDEAVERCREAIELVPTHRGANSYLFHSLVALGRTAEAAEVARVLLEIEEAGADALERATRSPDDAIDTLRRHRLAVLEAEYARGVASPSRLALAHLALGHERQALTLLEEGVEERWGWLYPFLAVYPLLDPLADEPRFQRMVERVGAPMQGAARGSYR